MGSEAFLRELSPEELRVLQQLYHQTPDSTIRTRCHILLLSVQQYGVHRIAQLLFSTEDAVVSCINDFNREGLDAILTMPRFHGVGAFGRDYSLKGEG